MIENSKSLHRKLRYTALGLRLSQVLLIGGVVLLFISMFTPIPSLLLLLGAACTFLAIILAKICKILLIYLKEEIHQQRWKDDIRIKKRPKYY